LLNFRNSTCPDLSWGQGRTSLLTGMHYKTRTVMLPLKIESNSILIVDDEYTHLYHSKSSLVLFRLSCCDHHPRCLFVRAVFSLEFLKAFPADTGCVMFSEVLPDLVREFHSVTPAITGVATGKYCPATRAGDIDRSTGVVFRFLHSRHESIRVEVKLYPSPVAVLMGASSTGDIFLRKR